MTPSQNIYERILKLPLFSGMSKNELTQVVTETKFEFVSVVAKKTLIREGDACTHIYFLLDGTLHMTTTPDDRRFAVTETVTAPEILQPEYSFGMTQRFNSTFVAATDCCMLRIRKNDITTLIEHFDVFRINLINMLAMQSQRQRHHLWRATLTDARRKVVRFFETHCYRPAGEKLLTIRMQQIADDIGETRRDVSNELNRLQDEGLITLSRGQIHIPALERLLM